MPKMVPTALPHRLTALLLLLPLLAACQPARKPDALSLESRLRLAATLDGPRGGAASVEVLREAVQRAPQDGALREKLALAAERAGRDGEAAQALGEAIALLGPTPSRLLALGRLELRAGNAAAAAAAFADANARAPGNPAVLGSLGLAQDLSGDPARAQDAYRAALLLAPRDWGIRANYAMSLLLTGQAGTAAEMLAEAEYAPDAPRRARHNLALALAATARPDRAVRLLRLDMGPAEAAAMGQELTAIAGRLDPSPAPAPLPPVARRAAGRASPPDARAMPDLASPSRGRRSCGRICRRRPARRRKRRPGRRRSSPQWRHSGRARIRRPEPAGSGPAAGTGDHFAARRALPRPALVQRGTFGGVPGRPAAGGGIADGIGPRIGGAEQPERPPRLRHRAAAVGEFQRGPAGRAAGAAGQLRLGMGGQPVGQADAQPEIGARGRGQVGGAPATAARRSRAAAGRRDRELRRPRGRRRRRQGRNGQRGDSRRRRGGMGQAARCRRSRSEGRTGRRRMAGARGAGLGPGLTPGSGADRRRGPSGLGLDRLPAPHPGCRQPLRRPHGARGTIEFLRRVAADQAGLDLRPVVPDLARHRTALLHAGAADGQGLGRRRQSGQQGRHQDGRAAEAAPAPPPATGQIPPPASHPMLPSRAAGVSPPRSGIDAAGITITTPCGKAPIAPPPRRCATAHIRAGPAPQRPSQAASRAGAAAMSASGPQ
nr:hypothetical protein [Dankookia rubra]